MRNFLACFFGWLMDGVRVLVITAASLALILMGANLHTPILKVQEGFGVPPLETVIEKRSDEPPSVFKDSAGIHLPKGSQVPLRL